MFGEIQTNIFEGINRVEDYFQILAIFLFLFVAFLSLPMDMSDLQLVDSIPLRFWIFTAMPIPVLLASGILRWVSKLGNTVGDLAIEEIEEKIENKQDTEEDNSNTTVQDADRDPGPEKEQAKE